MPPLPEGSYAEPRWVFHASLQADFCSCAGECCIKEAPSNSSGKGLSNYSGIFSLAVDKSVFF